MFIRGIERQPASFNAFSGCSVITKSFSCNEVQRAEFLLASLWCRPLAIYTFVSSQVRPIRVLSQAFNQNLNGLSSISSVWSMCEGILKASSLPLALNVKSS